jgi:hypothetical protein
MPNETRILYAYIDEMGTPSSCGNEEFALGAFLSETDIPEELMCLAFERLAADPDIIDMDRETIQRGYFHASEDSKNAHSLPALRFLL